MPAPELAWLQPAFRRCWGTHGSLECPWQPGSTRCCYRCWRSRLGARRVIWLSLPIRRRPPFLPADWRGWQPVGSPKYIALAGYVALLTAVFLLLGRFLKLGFIADFLSRTVLVGFLTGVGFQVGTAVLGETLGLEVHSRRTVSQWMEISRGLAGVHMPTLLVSGSVLAVVLLLKRVVPKVPGALVAVVGATAASAMLKLSAHGVATIGPVAGGLPHLGLQLLGWKEIVPLISIAGACAVMIITQSAATARVYALRHDQQVDENQDLIGLCAANAAAALSGSFVVNGSPSQTATVESVGSQSQIAQIAAACVVACVLLFLTGPLEYLPQCVLGALVLLVAIHLIDLRGMVNMRKESPGRVYSGCDDGCSGNSGRGRGRHPAGNGAVVAPHCAP